MMTTRKTFLTLGLVVVAVMTLTALPAQATTIRFDDSHDVEPTGIVVSWDGWAAYGNPAFYDVGDPRRNAGSIVHDENDGAAFFAGIWVPTVIVTAGHVGVNFLDPFDSSLSDTFEAVWVCLAGDCAAAGSVWQMTGNFMSDEGPTSPTLLVGGGGFNVATVFESGTEQGIDIIIPFFFGTDSFPRDVAIDVISNLDLPPVVTEIPEPASLLLLGTGLVFCVRRLRKGKPA